MFAKLVSHRAKSFSTHEQSLESFTQACQSDVPSIEIDLRCSRDGTLYVYHDPDLKLANGTSINIYELSDSQLNAFRFDNGESLMSLDTCFSTFSCRKLQNQQLCLDIKDYGFEADILRTIERFAIMENIVFVSWIPQTLFKLKQLNVTRPLILSCYFWPRFTWSRFLLLSLVRIRSLSWGQLLYIGKYAFQDSLRFKKGKHVAYCSNELPDELVNLLRGNHGGICLHHQLIDDEVRQVCQANQLALWTYPIKTIELYETLKKDALITAILCDNTPEILNKGKI